MNTLESLPLQERTALLVIVKGPTLHLRFLWGIEKKIFSYENKIALYGHIVPFSYDIVVGGMPPTIAIIHNWWDLEDLPVPSPHTAASKFNKMQPDEHSIPKAEAVEEQARIPLACIALLALVHRLLTVPYLSAAAP